jgi:hypothetical protein
LDEAESDPQAAATAMAEAADTLAALTAVRLPDGQVLPVDNTDLVALLQQAQQDAVADARAAVRTRLDALLTARAQAQDRRAWADDETWDALEAILSRDAFAEAKDPTGGTSMWDDLTRALARWIARFGGQPLVDDVLTGLGVIIVIVALAYLLRHAWRPWVSARRQRKEALPTDAAEYSIAGARARATALAEAGNYRQAMRYLYLATLLWLDEQRVLRYDPALTNREYLRRVDVPLSEALLPVVDLFDRVWYGVLPLDRRGYAAYVKQVARVREIGAAPRGDDGEDTA